MAENKDVRLTRLAACAGCGAKVGAGTLQKLLSGLPSRFDEKLIVGYDTSDDASVYVVNDETAVVQTVDFFPPIVDDPHMFGQIAACNAMSDIYAMGGEPKLGLNIMTVTKDMDENTIRDILRGGYEKAYEAGAIITGGHTIHDTEPKYGLAVTGFIHPKKVLMNSTAKPGDVLILTKPLGIGIITTAHKAGLVPSELMDRVTVQMATLNRLSRNNMVCYDVHSCTDVTGFSLMGHGYEMAAGSDTTLHIDVSGIRYHKEAYEFASMGFVPAGAYKNRDYVGDHYETVRAVERAMLDILFDPQTSGGLLISVSEADADRLLTDLQYHTDAAIIGYVTGKIGSDIVLE